MYKDQNAQEIFFHGVEKPCSTLREDDVTIWTPIAGHLTSNVRWRSVQSGFNIFWPMLCIALDRQ